MSDRHEHCEDCTEMFAQLDSLRARLAAAERAHESERVARGVAESALERVADELKRAERERDGYLKRMRQYEKDWQEAVAREGRLRDQMRESDEADTVCRILLHQELDAEREKVEELVTFAAYVVGVTDLLDHGDHAPPVEALRIARRKALELSGLAAHGGES